MGGTSLLAVTRKIWVSESRRDKGKAGKQGKLGLALEVRVDLKTALEGTACRLRKIISKSRMFAVQPKPQPDEGT